MFLKRALPLVALAVLVAGCSDGLVRPQVEKGIEAALPEYIGPAKEYKVRVKGTTMRMVKGRISNIHIEGTAVQLDPKLLVDSMVVDMDDVRVDTKTRAIRSVKSTLFEAKISESAINKYIESTKGADSGLAVALKKNGVKVSVHPDVLGIGIPISVVGRPVLRGNSAVDFVADSSSIAALPIPAALARSIINRMNPVFDMASMKFPVKLSSISVDDGIVQIKGSAEIGKAPDARR